jgi:hypothetical protein
MSKIKPDLLFEIWTPDEVAECLAGVTDAGLYEKLWTLVEDYPDQRSPEEMEYPDAKMSNNLAQFWNRFSSEEQAKLNQLASDTE